MAIRFSALPIWVLAVPKGTFSLREIEGVHLPFGLAIERDLGFATSHPLSRWAQAARQTGSIIAAEQLLRATPGAGRTDLPVPS
ncbi:hypothetical protein Sbs19_18190 [Sphingobium sp. BS19]|nr:hypothetical protein Sbs19_18190 [Sphingobium sp. BS19]